VAVAEFVYRQADGLISHIATAFHPMAFSSPVVFPSGLATSGQTSRLPAARSTARGGVSVMADNPVSTVRNRPFISKIWFITSSILLRPNRITGIVDVCAPWGAIRFELGAIVSTMMRGILAETGYAGCDEFITTSWRIFA
jgi:hypothetical protein